LGPVTDFITLLKKLAAWARAGELFFVLEIKMQLKGYEISIHKLREKSNCIYKDVKELHTVKKLIKFFIC
jgi:hypothetical protein